jgi:HEAT repeat protein
LQTTSGAVAQLLLSVVPTANGNQRRVEVALGWLGHNVQGYLLSALDDDGCRESAARVVGSLGLSEAVPGLVRCLDDGRPDVRRAAVQALGRIRDASTMDLLLRCTTDADLQVRAEAHLALNGYGMAPVVAAVA